jgi:hypothetical protein
MRNIAKQEEVSEQVLESKEDLEKSEVKGVRINVAKPWKIFDKAVGA